MTENAETAPVASSWSETELWRKILAFAFCIDAGGVVDIGLRATMSRPERVEELTGVMGLFAGSPLLRVALGLIAIGAAVAFSWKPGRVKAALVALVCTGVNYTFTAEFTGSVPNVLVCTGLCLMAWMATFVVARLIWRPADRPADFLIRVERLAAVAALAAFGVYFAKAGLSKYLNSGWDWTDGSKIRALMLMYAYPPDSLIGGVQEAILHSATLARVLATVTLLGQIGGIIFPFTRKGRVLVGTILLGFEVSVYFLSGIFAPGNIILILGFSYPWHRLGKRGREADDDRRPLRLPRVPTARVMGLVLMLAGLVGAVAASPLAPIQLGSPTTHTSSTSEKTTPHAPPPPTQLRPTTP